MRYSAIGAARRVAVGGMNPPHHRTHQSEVHMRIAQKGDACVPRITSATQLWHRRRRCV
jgi:hypothetical protein